MVYRWKSKAAKASAQAQGDLRVMKASASARGGLDQSATGRDVDSLPSDSSAALPSDDAVPGTRAHSGVRVGHVLLAIIVIVLILAALALLGPGR